MEVTPCNPLELLSKKHLSCASNRKDYQVFLEHNIFSKSDFNHFKSTSNPAIETNSMEISRSKHEKKRRKVITRKNVIVQNACVDVSYNNISHILSEVINLPVHNKNGFCCSSNKLKRFIPTQEKTNLKEYSNLKVKNETYETAMNKQKMIDTVIEQYVPLMASNKLLPFGEQKMTS